MSCVAQLLQNLAVSVLSDWHFGHLTAIADPFYQAWVKVIKDRGASQMKADLARS